jgi:acetyl-CoA C-acetyltransferase
MSEAFIIDAVRTPIGVGKTGGALQPLEPVELSALVLNEIVTRNDVNPSRIDDVIWGCVTQIDDQGANLARLSLLQAGFPSHVPGVTINRMCGSSQQAVHFAAQAIIAGDMDLVIAGGTEMMSHQSLGADYPKTWPKDFPYELVHQGVSAEMMAEKWGLKRDEMDDYGYQSHLRAMKAIQKGWQRSEILPVRLPNDKVFDADEGVRIPPNREKMSQLNPVFKLNGVITAGNASQLSDGSAAILLASPKAIGVYNLSPRARVVARYVTGSDPVLMLDAPIPATKKVLEQAGLTLDDIDIIEINEAFASVVLAWAKELGVEDFSRVNPHGGAIAHGHPLGATGAVLMTKLLNELEMYQGKYGLQVMCIGHGMATATILERL